MQQPTISIPSDLIHAAQGGDGDAMWQIISAYDLVLLSMVRAAAPSAGKSDTEDLHQEARVALMQHIRAYDTESAAGLSTFAFRAVRRAITEEWVRLSVHSTIDPTQVIRVRRALWSSGDDVEGAWEIVSTVENPRHRMSRETFVSVCEALAGVLSLDAMALGGSDADSLKDTIPDASSSFTDVTERRDLARFLLGEINSRQAYALRAQHGIGTMAMTDDETSAELGLSSRGSHAALRQLRQRGITSARTVATAHGFSVAA